MRTQFETDTEPQIMDTKPTLYICMGSACHQYGVYHVLPALQRLLNEHRLDVNIELKGAFCLGPCMHGIVLKLEEREFRNISAANIEQKFTMEVLPLLQRLA